MKREQQVRYRRRVVLFITVFESYFPSRQSDPSYPDPYEHLDPYTLVESMKDQDDDMVRVVAHRMGAARADFVGRARANDAPGIASSESVQPQHRPADGDAHARDDSDGRQRYLSGKTEDNKPSARDIFLKRECSQERPDLSPSPRPKRKRDATDEKDTTLVPKRRKTADAPAPGPPASQHSMQPEQMAASKCRKRSRDNDADEPEPTSESSRPFKKAKTEPASSPTPTRPSRLVRSGVRQGASLPPRKRPVRAAQVAAAPATLDVLTSIAPTQPSTPAIAAADSDAQNSAEALDQPNVKAENVPDVVSSLLATARRTRSTRSANIAVLVELDAQGKLVMQRQSGASAGADVDKDADLLLVKQEPEAPPAPHDIEAHAEGGVKRQDTEDDGKAQARCQALIWCAACRGL
jgi:hypothetical protein